jgi:hypothetical protein
VAGGLGQVWEKFKGLKINEIDTIVSHKTPTPPTIQIPSKNTFYHTVYEIIQL